MEPHPAGVLRGEALDLRRARIPIVRRPAAPARPKVFGEHAEVGELAQRFALLPAVVVEAGIAGEAPPKLRQRLHLECKNAIALDTALVVERPRGRGHGSDVSEVGEAGSL